MAKTSGGIRNSPRRKQDGAPNGATEKGYTQKMARNITLAEGTIRNNRDESLLVFSPEGDLLKRIQGKGPSVSYAGITIPENSIITHNHPRALGQKGIKAIGNSFSQDDIVSAVSTNAKEIRAVTPTYTFSVKRPKGGWGGSPEQIGTAFARASRDVNIELRGYVARQDYSDTSVARAETTHFHKVMQKMSKQYGWIYSKKRG